MYTHICNTYAHACAHTHIHIVWWMCTHARNAHAYTYLYGLVKPSISTISHERDPCLPAHVRSRHIPSECTNEHHGVSFVYVHVFMTVYMHSLLEKPERYAHDIPRLCMCFCSIPFVYVYVFDRVYVPRTCAYSLQQGARYHACVRYLVYIFMCLCLCVCRSSLRGYIHACVCV